MHRRTRAHSGLVDVIPRGWLVSLVLVTTACGGTVVFEDDSPVDQTAGPGGDDDAPAPTALYVSTRDACGVEAPISETVASLTTDDSGGDLLFVVELGYVDECTGLGGQHILARAVDGSKEMWLGAHGCRFFEPELIGERTFGLARAWQTAGLFSTSADECVTFPGESEGLFSDVNVSAIAVFQSQEAAEAFVEAESLGR